MCYDAMFFGDHQHFGRVVASLSRMYICRHGCSIINYRVL